MMIKLSGLMSNCKVNASITNKWMIVEISIVVRSAPTTTCRGPSPAGRMGLPSLARRAGAPVWLR